MSTAKPTRVRHKILGLTVLVYFITYLDRVLISNAMPVIQKQFGFSIETAGLVLSCYAVAYAVFQIPGGWLATVARALPGQCGGVVVHFAFLTAFPPRRC